MENKTDKLIISDINSSLFVIPYYQRGYRWTGKNVKQLLSDLYSFANKNMDSDPEYCLQPIVLQKLSTHNYSNIITNEENVIRVVDGQQRLTTIAIILRILGIETTWDIYYDTEKKRLSEILNENGNLSSINNYFRKEVSDAVDEWFNTNKDEENQDSSKGHADKVAVLKGLFESKNKGLLSWSTILNL